MNKTKQLRKFWGWGYENVSIEQEHFKQVTTLLRFSLGIEKFEQIPIPSIENIVIREPRFSIPDIFQHYTSSEKYHRLSHTYGKSYKDTWKGLQGNFENPPDYVAYPRNEAHIQELMEFAEKQHIALIPYGGGSSVVGAVETPTSPQYNGAIVVDMQYFDQVLEIDTISRAARIQAGIYGPALEKQLKVHRLSLRHFPQSFEFSTLGGWIATHSAGHYATLHTHISQAVESLRIVTPQGIIQTPRFPASGAGPQENQLWVGSEGALGIITEAWMRLQDIPQYKNTVTVRFKKFEQGVEAARALVQSGLHPSNARLVDALEAASNGLGNGSSTVLIVGFESAYFPVQEKMEKALKICQQYEGKWAEVPIDSSANDPSARVWKNAFLQMPYWRDELMRLGLIVETFETAITWDKFMEFHAKVEKAVKEAIRKYCGQGTITCRFTHLYPDGPAPYYTVIAKGRNEEQLLQWEKIKEIASQAIIAYGGTITHHHAVGRDHREFFQKQQSPLFIEALKAVKQRLDPNSILNPEVLIPPTKA